MHNAILKLDNNPEQKKIFIENLAPIVLFTYNRLEHTMQTVQALQNNVYAQDSHLYIYSDAPKDKAVSDKVETVRQYLETIDGFKKVTVIKRDENWGVAKNIIDGVTRIVNEYGKIIVLEDDIVTSKYFLKYMNDALAIYKDEKRVMAISGYMYPIKKDDLPDTFFSSLGGWCWGWATWAESWKCFERDPERIINEFSKEDIYTFTLENSTTHWQQILDNYEGKIYTWAAFWSVSTFRHGGLTLCSKFNMADNIGFDGSGEHCGKCDALRARLNNSEVLYNIKFNLRIEENIVAKERIKQFYLKCIKTDEGVFYKIVKFGYRIIKSILK